MKASELDLLLELGKLLKKYGPEAFRSVAGWITSSDLIEIASLLNQVARVPKRVPSEATNTSVKATASGTGGTGKMSKPKALHGLRTADPEKHKVLTEFHAQLVDRNILPELRDVREFARMAGFKEHIKGGSRQKAINPLVNMLAGLTADQLKQVIQREKNRDRTGKTGLEGWTEVILERGRKNRGKSPRVGDVW